MNSTSELLYDTEARTAMIKGVQFLARAVEVTLGPKGKNVALFKQGKLPHLTKDGVTVANAINLKDRFENLGVQLVKEAAQRSAEIAGDGTTTSTVIANRILSEGSQLLSTGLDPRDFVTGIQQAVSDVLENLEVTKYEIGDSSDLINIATISANGDEKIGTLIAEAIETVGDDGAITVEQAKGFDTRLEIVDGTVIERGFLSPYFVTNESKGVAELERVSVIVYNQTLNSPQPILPALEHAAKNNCSVLVIANDITNEALQTMVINKMKGALRICAIKAPEFGAARTTALQDIASIVGAKVIAVDEQKNSQDSCIEAMGFCQKAVIDKNGCVLIDTSGEELEIKARVENARSTLESPSSTDSDIATAGRRLRRLSKGIGIIRVGGATEVEMIERKDRIDDALHAAKAASKSGTQPGGGSALFHASTACKSSGKDSFLNGYNTLLNACQEPLRKIVENSGGLPEMVAARMRKYSRTKIGYNAVTKKFGDLREMGVIDPHLVVVSSLEHAASVACNLLLVGCAVVTTEENSGEVMGLIETI